MAFNKVHCFFEQSGTFKNEFIKLGIPAFDYDLANDFNQVDFQIDLFTQIHNVFEPAVFHDVLNIEHAKHSDDKSRAVIRSMISPDYANRFIKMYLM